MTPIKQAIEAMEAAISDDQPYIFKCKLALAALRAQPAPPPYPEGDVVMACVCGSWPGGKCLKCRWVPAQPDPIPYSGADENPPVFARRWKLARDGFGLEREDMNGNYVDIDDALSVLHAAQPAECTRSHPHELMDGYCELRTEIARLTNENARLRAQPDHRQLVKSLRLGASISRERSINLDFAKIADEAADALEGKV